jgi:hypothetical protein
MKEVVFKNTIENRIQPSHADLAAEAIQGPPLSLQSINNVHGSHRLAPGMLGVGHSISDDILQKDLQHAASLLIDEPADTLHSPPTGQAPDRRLGNPLDVVAQHLPVTLSATLAETLASLAAPRHGCRGRRTPKASKNTRDRVSERARARVSARRDWKR